MKITNKSVILLFTSLMFIIIILNIYVSATPIGPDIFLRNFSSGFNNSRFPVRNTSAIAGNVTELSIDAITSTRSWQGFFGNITGEIFLQDSNGYVFYNWTTQEPNGEIYASPNSSITWANVKCLNYTANGSTALNLTSLESLFNISSYADDGVDVTYAYLNNPSFYVGSVLISANACPTAYINQNNNSQSSNFPNMLLTDNVSIVFSTLIENTDSSNSTDKAGYNGVNYDFQLLVTEDGRTDFLNPQVTTYYFWIELNT